MKTGRSMLVVGLLIVLAGCATPLSTREKGTLVGAAVGTGAGAAIGSASGHTAAGALIGAGVGAVGGALIGDSMQANEQRQAAPPPPPQPPPPPAVAAPPPPPPPVAVVAPPPVVVASPHYVWVPQWGVYVLEGHDVIYHDGHHYYAHGDRWYVSRSHRGPWAMVQVRPAVLHRVPHGHFHRHLPPGLEKKGKVPPGHRY
jgi:Glycine zipper